MDPSLQPERIPDSVARSLAVFQLGESGGGTVVAQARASKLPEIDEHYAAAVALFVNEEHRHAELLAICVRMLGGELIQKNWTARAFVRIRRLIGLRTKVLVLLAAEVVGLCYYNLITSRLPDGRLREYLQEIADDERAHLRFHSDFLRTQVRTSLRRVVFLSAWRLTMLMAGVAVLLDHHKALADLRIPLLSLWRAWSGYAGLVERLVLEHSTSQDHCDGAASPAVAIRQSLCHESVPRERQY